jgi:hypothetical protein
MSDVKTAPVILYPLTEEQKAELTREQAQCCKCSKRAKYRIRSLAGDTPYCEDHSPYVAILPR